MLKRAQVQEVTGTRRAVPLRSGPRASHIDPDGPRALLERDGTAWKVSVLPPTRPRPEHFWVTYLPRHRKAPRASGPPVRSPAEVVIASPDRPKRGRGLTLLVSVASPPVISATPDCDGYVSTKVTSALDV
ncbi:DUF6087 family protein [Streptomyces sp. TRM70350]|uniref:DUF6087 family protein n=1 Tax=Streptomyces sp. TRM70350 TaxID=2856165 RepID=UPI0035A8C965